MDIIVEGYLKRFVEDFGLDPNETDINFEKICFYSILNSELNNLDDDDLDEVSIGKNKGIDGICISIDERIITNVSEIEDIKESKRNFNPTLYFIQAKTSSKFSDSEIANFCDTVIDFLSEIPKYDLTSKAKEYHNIYLQILELLSYVRSFNCKLFYCSTGIWNNATSSFTTLKIKENAIKKLNIFNIVQVNVIDNEKIRRLYDRATQPLKTEFDFKQKTTMTEITNVKESYRNFTL